MFKSNHGWILFILMASIEFHNLTGGSAITSIKSNKQSKDTTTSSSSEYSTNLECSGVFSTHNLVYCMFCSNALNEEDAIRACYCHEAASSCHVNCLHESLNLNDEKQYCNICEHEIKVVRTSPSITSLTRELLNNTDHEVYRSTAIIDLVSFTIISPIWLIVLSLCFDSMVNYNATEALVPIIVCVITYFHWMVVMVKYHYKLVKRYMAEYSDVIVEGIVETTSGIPLALTKYSGFKLTIDQINDDRAWLPGSDYTCCKICGTGNDTYDVIEEDDSPKDVFVIGCLCEGAAASYHVQCICNEIFNIGNCHNCKECGHVIHVAVRPMSKPFYQFLIDPMIPYIPTAANRRMLDFSCFLCSTILLLITDCYWFNALVHYKTTSSSNMVGSCILALLATVGYIIWIVVTTVLTHFKTLVKMKVTAQQHLKAFKKWKTVRREYYYVGLEELCNRNETEDDKETTL